MTTNQDANLLLHPVRLRLVTELFGRQMTAKQLAKALPDIPQASLYRHIKRLLEGKILVITHETMVNGPLERTYSVGEGRANLSGKMQAITPAEHARYFSIFAASLIDSFTRYTQHAPPSQIGQDGMSYSRAVIYLSPEEKEAFEQQIRSLLGGIIAQGPAPNRQRYTLASIVIPDERPSGTAQEETEC